MYLRLIADLLDELDQEDDLGRSSQAVIALDQQPVGAFKPDGRAANAGHGTDPHKRGAIVCARSLQAAHNRLDDDSSGVCHDCGEDIAPKRLAFNPAVRHCLSCASG